MAGPTVYSVKLGVVGIALEPGNADLIFEAAAGFRTILRSVILNYHFGTDAGQVVVQLFSVSTGSIMNLLDSGNDSTHASTLHFEGRVVMDAGDQLVLYNPAGADGGNAYAWASGYELTLP